MTQTARISAIAIISKNRGLGIDNHLLFHIPGELPRFKKITTGHPVIMGRKTFESIGRVLPNRTNIIITQNANFKVENAIVVHSLDEALEEAERVDENEIFILGGGQIFQEALPFTNRLYLTIVEKEVAADRFFPDYSSFTKVVAKEVKTDWDYPYTFLTLERK